MYSLSLSLRDLIFLLHALFLSMLKTLLHVHIDHIHFVLFFCPIPASMYLYPLEVRDYSYTTKSLVLSPPTKT